MPPGLAPLSPSAVQPGIATVHDVRLGDRLELRKPHPCGSHHWTVVRVGLDIGLRCDGCGHRVLMVRSELERHVLGRVRSEPDTDAGIQPDA